MSSGQPQEGSVKPTIRIGNAQAFWGDRPSAARDILRQLPEIDYLTMDYLAEVSMSILAMQRQRQPELGYPTDFVEVVKNLADYWSSGGNCRLIANAGGLNPSGCAQACIKALEEVGCRSLKIAVVSGDNVLAILTGEQRQRLVFRNLDDARSLDAVRDRLVTANAYMGCQGIVQALRSGAAIVITGRVADPSMVLAACIDHFDWPMDDWNRLAQGTVAGHLLECGTQVTGGISTDWLSVPAPDNIGFPLVEMNSDGSFVVTKPPGTGGAVNEQTVKEQLVYEIGDPARYLSPDVQVSFLDLEVRQVGQDRVDVRGARGEAPTSTLKVSATYRDGYRAAGMLTIFGLQAAQKARRSGQVVLQQLRDAGWDYRDTLVECLGNPGSLSLPQVACQESESLETVMRIAVEADSKPAVEAFSKSLMALVTAGAQGTTGYAEGRPRVHSVFRYWPCLIPCSEVSAQVETLVSRNTLADRTSAITWPASRSQPAATSPGITSLDVPDHPLPNAARDDQLNRSPLKAVATAQMRPRRLIDVAYGRSGDKGTSANVGILVRNAQDYAWLQQWLTADRVHSYFSELNVTAVRRFEIPNLGGLNFLLEGVLRSGLRNDAQGKTLAQALLAMPLDELQAPPEQSFG